jgi:putative transposase
MPYDDLRKGRNSEPLRIYFVTTVLACRSEACFSDFQCARIAVSGIRDAHEAETADALAWVIMPDYVHWLFQLREDSSLSVVVKRYKAVTAQRINRLLGRKGSLWQRTFFDHAVRRDEDIQDIARYIVMNPLRAGLVERISEYPHWDAKWL